MSQQQQQKPKRWTGRVLEYNTQKRFGWIAIDNNNGSGDIFVHYKEIKASGYPMLNEGEPVEFEIGYSTDGKRRAIHVTGPNGSFVQGEGGGYAGGYGGGYGGGYRAGRRRAPSSGYGGHRGRRRAAMAGCGGFNDDNGGGYSGYGRFSRSGTGVGHIGKVRNDDNTGYGGSKSNYIDRPRYIAKGKDKETSFDDENCDDEDFDHEPKEKEKQWAIQRCMELSEYDAKNTVIMWIKKIKKSEQKQHKRLMVITDFRLFTARRGGSKKKPKFEMKGEAHILALTSVQEAGLILNINFRDFDVSFECNDDDLTQKILGVLYRNYTFYNPGFPMDMTCKWLDQYKASQEADLRKKYPVIGDSLAPWERSARAFRSYLCYYREPNKDKVALRFENILRQPMDEEKSDERWLHTKSLGCQNPRTIHGAILCVAFTLELLHGVEISDVKGDNNLLFAIQTLLRYNTTLGSLILDGCATGPEWGHIAVKALMDNPNIALKRFGLRNCKIGDKGVQYWIEGNKKLQRHLTCVYLTNANCSTQTMINFIQSLPGNGGGSGGPGGGAGGLEELDIGDNPLSSNGTLMLADRLVKDFHNLKMLNVERCNIDCPRLLTAIENASKKGSLALEEINLKHNKLNLQNTMTLSRVLAHTGSCKALSLAGCGLGKDAIESLLATLLAAGKPMTVLDLRGNQVAQKGCHIIAQILHLSKKSIKTFAMCNVKCAIGKIIQTINYTSIQKLILADNDLATMHIAQTISCTDDLSYIDLSQCNLSINTVIQVFHGLKYKSKLTHVIMNQSLNNINDENTMKKMDMALSEFVYEARQLQSLSLKNNDPIPYPMDFCRFIRSLRQHDGIRSLNISGQFIVNQNIHALADALQHHYSLKTFIWVDHSMSYTQMDKFRKCVKNNKYLTINIASNKRPLQLTSLTKKITSPSEFDTWADKIVTDFGGLVEIPSLRFDIEYDDMKDIVKPKCYYTDKSFDSKGTQIGLMLNLKISDDSDNKHEDEKDGKHNKENDIISLEIISYSKDCISLSVWDKLNIHIDSKHEEFTHFLPIIINEEHGKRVSKILTRKIAKMIDTPEFTVEYGLPILVAMLSNVIKILHNVLFIRKQSKQSYTQIITDNLTLWCHLHHILLQLCVSFPDMQTAADSKIGELFMNNDNNNDNNAKLSQIPDLGTLIMYLLISEQYTWHTMSRLWVEESFSRDCKKICENDKDSQLKNLLDNTKLPDKERLDIMYKHTKESRSFARLLIAFLTLHRKVSIVDQLRLYDSRWGSPHPLWVEEITDEAELIADSTSWREYFSGIYVVTPKQKVLSNLLLRCFIRGAQNGYYQIKTKLMKQNMNHNNDNDDLKREVSEYSAQTHKPQAIAKFDQFPDWIKKGCSNKTNNENDPVINKFNKLQSKIIGDLCLGNDSIIISPPGSGKTMAVIMSSFYRLYVQTAPTHILFIAVDRTHVQLLTGLCQKLGEFVPDLTVWEQVRGSSNITQHQLSQCRNIFICSPRKAVNLCENGQNNFTENLIAVNIFDCDTLMVDPSFNKLKSTLKWIATNTNVNFISNSMCVEMQTNMSAIVDYQSNNTKQYILTNRYNNLKFWFIYCGARKNRIRMLRELCKVNPYSQGVIFCTGPSQATIVSKSLQSSHSGGPGTDSGDGCGSFTSRIFGESENTISDSNQIISLYNNGSIQYIIAHEYSPIYLLYKILPKNLKIIIDFEIENASSYLKRCSISKYESKSKKIHIISLIDEDQTKTYEKVEEICNVELEILPSNVAQVLVDEKQNDNNDNDDDDEGGAATPATTEAAWLRRNGVTGEWALCDSNGIPFVWLGKLN